MMMHATPVCVKFLRWLSASKNNKKAVDINLLNLHVYLSFCNLKRIRYYDKQVDLRDHVMIYNA